MQFNSIPFLFYFLPVFLAAYYIFPKSWRGGVLVLGSLLFYWLACGHKLWCLGLLVGLTLLTYFAGRALERFRREWLLGGFLALLAAILVFLKCYQAGSWLPVGLSFYLFQMAGYLVDVYCRRAGAERNLLSYGAEITMFPKLLSGPLAEPNRLQVQAQNPCCCVRVFHLGLQELILGLGMKTLLADRLGGLWAQAGVIGYQSISAPFAWMALTAYAMRLYFDFWGYSLMAQGLGRMLGYHLPKNFLEPYSAKSVSDFYRRWHATLGAWFRKYIYYPLGGSRKGTGRTLVNLCVVWAMTGFWHGVGGNYMLWAAFLCLLIINERLWLGKILNRSRIICHVYTVFMILLSWAPFAIGDWGELKVFLERLFGLGAGALNGQDYLVWGREYGGMLLAGVLFATPLPKKLWHRIQSSAFADVILFLLFWIAIYFIATSAQDPFLYFQY